MERLRKDIGQFGIFFDGCPMPTNGFEAVSQTGMVCEDTRGSFLQIYIPNLPKPINTFCMSDVTLLV
jgi:hypothetical protein